MAEVPNPTGMTLPSPGDPSPGIATAQQQFFGVMQRINTDIADCISSARGNIDLARDCIAGKIQDSLNRARSTISLSSDRMDTVIAALLCDAWSYAAVLGITPPANAPHPPCPEPSFDSTVPGSTIPIGQGPNLPVNPPQLVPPLVPLPVGRVVPIVPPLRPIAPAIPPATVPLAPIPPSPQLPYGEYEWWMRQNPQPVNPIAPVGVPAPTTPAAPVSPVYSPVPNPQSPPVGGPTIIGGTTTYGGNSTISSTTNQSNYFNSVVSNASVINTNINNIVNNPGTSPELRAIAEALQAEARAIAQGANAAANASQQQTVNVSLTPETIVNIARKDRVKTYTMYDDIVRKDLPESQAALVAFMGESFGYLYGSQTMQELTDEVSAQLESVAPENWLLRNVEFRPEDLEV